MNATALILLILFLIAVGVSCYYAVICIQSRPAGEKIPRDPDMGLLLPLDDLNGNHEEEPRVVESVRHPRPSLDQPDSAVPKPEEEMNLVLYPSNNNEVEVPLKPPTFQTTPECASMDPHKDGSVVLLIDNDEPSLLNSSKSILPPQHEGRIVTKLPSSRTLPQPPIQTLPIAKEPPHHRTAVHFPTSVSDGPLKTLSVSFEEDGLLVPGSSSTPAVPQEPSNSHQIPTKILAMSLAMNSQAYHQPHPQPPYSETSSSKQVHFVPPSAKPQCIVNSSNQTKRLQSVLYAPHFDSGGTTKDENSIFVFGSKQMNEENGQPMKKAKIAGDDPDVIVPNFNKPSDVHCQSRGNASFAFVDGKDATDFSNVDPESSSLPLVGWSVIPRPEKYSTTELENSDERADSVPSTYEIIEEQTISDVPPSLESASPSIQTHPSQSDIQIPTNDHQEGKGNLISPTTVIQLPNATSSPMESKLTENDGEDAKDQTIPLDDNFVKVRIILPIEEGPPPPEPCSRDSTEETESENSDSEVTDYSFENGKRTNLTPVAAVLANDSESSDPDVTEYSFHRESCTSEPSIAIVLANEVGCYSDDKVGLTNYVLLSDPEVILPGNQSGKFKSFEQFDGHPPTPSDTPKGPSPASSTDTSLCEIHETELPTNVSETPSMTLPDSMNPPTYIIENPSAKGFSDAAPLPSFIVIDTHDSRERLQSSASPTSSSSSSSSSDGSYKIDGVGKDEKSDRSLGSSVENSKNSFHQTRLKK